MRPGAEEDQILVQYRSGRSKQQDNSCACQHSVGSDYHLKVPEFSTISLPERVLLHANYIWFVWFAIWCMLMEAVFKHRNCQSPAARYLAQMILVPQLIYVKLHAFPLLFGLVQERIVR